ncbi:MAG: hypothetical protein NTX57_05800 [Armatimonadetes bacterium]|nr:hypothetical protein [Armatimonadota bacterium]
MNLYTSSEACILLSAATNPARWDACEKGGYIAYQVPGLVGRVRLDVAYTENFSAIESRLRSIHPDTAIVIAWALSEMIGDPRAPHGAKPTSWALSRIVHEALGVDPWKVSSAKRQELLNRVVDALWLASRARVECQRPGEYNMGGKKKEACKIAAAPLLLQRLDLDASRPIVEMALSEAWRSNCTGILAQYLPVEDAFARISSARPGGAIARSLALWIVSQARVQRQAELKPIEPRKMLERFNAGIQLRGRHAFRIVEAWADALNQLAEVGLLAPCADTDPEALRRRLGVVERGNSTMETLLDSPVTFALGPVILDALEALEKSGNPLKVEQRPPKSGAAIPKSGAAVDGSADKNKNKGDGVSERATPLTPSRPNLGAGPTPKALFDAEELR